MPPIRLAFACWLGTVSYTGHVANPLAAFYVACGQDPACVAESQAAVTVFAEAGEQGEGGGDLYASMSLPSVIVSTVGGGTVRVAPPAPFPSSRVPRYTCTLQQGVIP